MTSQLKGLIIKNYELITRQKGSLICQVNFLIKTDDYSCSLLRIYSINQTDN